MLSIGTILISQNQNRVKSFKISDLHFDELRYFPPKLLRKINSIQPDLVFYNWKFSFDKTGKNKNR
jgi:hypothetical protein